MLENTKEGGTHTSFDSKEYWWHKEHHFVKVQWISHNTEDHGKWTNTLLINGGSTNTVNKKMAVSKDFKVGLLAIKDQNDIKPLIWKFNLYTSVQGNK